MRNNCDMRRISGPWSTDQIRNYLTTAVIPIRVATSGKTGPLVQSLWFLFDEDSIWCCTQRDALIVQRLERQPTIGFEVSADAPPYKGVRGQATASLEPSHAGAVLERLISRYQAPPALADWLLRRLDDEVAIALRELSVTSWDFTARMTRHRGSSTP
jgi:nitroimidazol reductase NimA-like FMN-containing flavoprotein (pyridoxamine 5'-phosphate oxidase superfamily)